MTWRTHSCVPRAHSWARLAILLCCSFAAANAAYVYDYANLLNPYTAGQWTANGTYSAATGMFTSSATNGGSLIFNSTVPGPAGTYEVRTTLTLASSGGNYYSYLRATSNSLAATGNTGTYYALQVANPTFSGGGCSATANLLKSVTGTVTIMWSGAISCHSGMVVRLVMAQSHIIFLYVDNLYVVAISDSSIAAGQPGIGVSSAPAGNGITAADIGHLDTVAPGAFNSQLIGTSVFSNRVDIQWPGIVDDANGTGIMEYQVIRSGVWLGLFPTPNFSDASVSPGTSYNYTLIANDFHGNASGIVIPVTTPAAGAIDPREIGVRPTGSYWGSGGEQIDMRSGNLNYTMPLLKALGRGGWGVGFSLNYNSQNWRQDPAGTWQLGRDVGYGYGWRMQAGALTPIYTGWYTIHHYVFTDSTGAQYNLSVNTGGVWTSTEGIYLYYDSNAGRLYFRDGSFWVMGANSSGTEQDAGTMYPTMMQDSNGNQVSIAYNTGVGATWTNSSARPSTIQDVRAGNYTFTYNADPIPHLTGITNSIGTSEKYSFTYTSGTLVSAFDHATGFGTFNYLQTATATGIPLTTTFAYDSQGSGELTQVTTPYGGHLRWTYTPSPSPAPAPSAKSRTATSRCPPALPKLKSNSSAPTTPLTPSIPPPRWMTSAPTPKSIGPSRPTLRYSTVVYNSRMKNDRLPGGTALSRQELTWTQTPTSLNPYISATLTTLDPGQTYQAQKKSTQTLDQYGNLTQQQIYNFGNLSTPARTYTNTYLDDSDCGGSHPCGSNYVARYIFNRLITSTVTDGTKTTTLATNVYDYSTLHNTSGITMHDAATAPPIFPRQHVSSSTSPPALRRSSTPTSAATPSIRPSTASPRSSPPTPPPTTLRRRKSPPARCPRA